MRGLETGRAYRGVGPQQPTPGRGGGRDGGGTNNPAIRDTLPGQPSCHSQQVRGRDTHWIFRLMALFMESNSSLLNSKHKDLELKGLFGEDKGTSDRFLALLINGLG